MKKIIITGLISLLAIFSAFADAGRGYLSPTRITLQPGTDNAYVMLSTAASMAVVDTKTEKVVATLPFDFTPGGFCFSPDGKTLYVTEYTPAGKLHLISVDTYKVLKSIPVGAYPAAVCVSRDGGRAWVANRFSNDLSVIDLYRSAETARLPMVREPRSLALSPDGRTLAVGNFIPGGTSLDPFVSAEVTLIDTEKSRIVSNIMLSDGSQQLEDICFSKDGSKIFATHLLSRYQFPTTHLERGWMNTNALSIIDANSRRLHATVLLDDQYRGAANPCGVSLSEDGDKLFVAITGTHEAIALDLPAMFKKMGEYPNPALLSNDLLFLNDIKQRTALPGKGSRDVVESNGKVFVTGYFSGGLSIIDPADYPETRFIKLGDEPEADDIRKGELFFADADLCYQNWQSCISCHPEARADGLNWDLMNDGMGNPKNSKSLLYSHVTPPSMITGIRADAETAVRAGIHHIQFAERPEQDAVCMDEYLKSLKALESPCLVGGKLSKNAKKGKVIYEKAGCLSCHGGTYYTDGKKYDVGTGIDEYKGFAFDTPALAEIWRTAPYLYNGGAKTIMEVLTTFNEGDRHGMTSNLSNDELAALEEYILSL